MKRVLAIGALLIALTGCGTVQNFQRESPSKPTPYGGVEIAVDRFSPSSQGHGIWLMAAWPAVVADVGLSAVGDTLTLPITVTLVVWRVVNIALFYDNTSPPSNPWRGFWFNETGTASGAHEAEHSTQPSP
jgi:uncharacterized protein YceK